MKKIICMFIAISLSLVLFSCGTDDNPPVGTTEKQETATSVKNNPDSPSEIKLETESFPEEARECAHIKAYDENGNVLWQFDTEKNNIGQLDGIQEIGLTSYGYLFNADGIIYCLGTNSEDSGKLLWKNEEFMGAGISFAFDESENLYICGYFGPDLMVVSNDGKTLSRYDSFGDAFFWPCEIELKNGYPVIAFENSNVKITADPDNGTITDIEFPDGFDYTELISGKWNGGIGEYGLELSLSDDGNYSAMLMNRTETTNYSGTWKLDDFTTWDYSDGSDEGKPGETIKGIFTTVGKTDDDNLKSIGSIGDFGLMNLRVESGKLTADFSQLNNGESILSWYSDEFCENGYTITMSKEF